MTAPGERRRCSVLRPTEDSALRTCRAYTFFPNIVPSWHQRGPTAFRKHCAGVCSLEADGELSSPAMALGLAHCFSFLCLHFGLWDFLELSFMFKKDSGGLPWWSSSYHSLLPLQGAQVRSLVGVLPMCCAM